MDAPEHIVFFIYSLEGGGAERVASRLCNYWATQNHRVTVVTQSLVETDQYTFDERIERVSLQSATISNNRVLAVLSNLKRIWLFRRLLRELKPNVVVSFMPESNVISLLSSIGFSHRSVIAERTYPPKQPLPVHWRMLRRYTYRLADVCVAQTDVAAHWLRDSCTVESVVIPNASYWPLPVNEPIVAPEAVLNSTRNVVLTVARLHPEKGIHRLIQSFALVADQNQSWDLVIGGDGPQWEHLHSLTNQLKLNGRVHFLGRIGNVSDWYTRADLVALTSDYEGFPNMLIEAMSCGTPCLSVDCLAGPSDIIDHDKNGWLVDSSEPTVFAPALMEAMEDSTKREQLGATALQCRTEYGEMSIHEKWDHVVF